MTADAKSGGVVVVNGSKGLADEFAIAIGTVVFATIVVCVTSGANVGGVNNDKMVVVVDEPIAVDELGIVAFALIVVCETSGASVGSVGNVNNGEMVVAVETAVDEPIAVDELGIVAFALIVVCETSGASVGSVGNVNNGEMVVAVETAVDEPIIVDEPIVVDEPFNKLKEEVLFACGLMVDAT